jgi:hypothetical protein
MSRLTRRAFACALLLAAACTPPPRASVDGYRAKVTTVVDGVAGTPFEIAVRGDDRWRRPASNGAVLVLKGKEQKAWLLDPAAKTFAAVPYPQATDEMLPGFPLAPSFDDRGEAERRGVTEYRRESDEIFAGVVCALWEFWDRKDDPVSPSTTFWVASSLENLAIRMDRETPRGDGTKSVTSVRLTEIRVGVDPKLFEIPKGYTAAGPR